jgi:hypothetical protein
LNVMFTEFITLCQLQYIILTAFILKRIEHDPMSQ